jgi:CO/xanthine dehydrogenase Mo-binding subunit
MRFEVLMDMLAEKLNMDPFDLRLKNVYREGSTTPTGQVPDSLSLPEMFEKLCLKNCGRNMRKPKPGPKNPAQTNTSAG